MYLLPPPSESSSKILLALFLSLWWDFASAGFIPINATTTITTPITPGSSAALSTTPAVTSPSAQTPSDNTDGLLSYTSFAINSSALQWAGTDFAAVSSVVECQSEYLAYSSRLDAFRTSACKAGKCSTTLTTYTTGDTSYFYPSYTGNLTTLCDGVPRATGEASPTKTITELRTNTIWPSYIELPPKCTYDPRGCGLLASASSAGLYQTVATQLDCIWGGNCMLPKEAKMKCVIQAGEMKVFYWPVSKDNEWLCTRTNAQGMPVTTSPPAGLVTATYEDMTFTSPSIYMSFQSIYGRPCILSETQNVWLSAPPESFSSVAFKPPWETAKPQTVTSSSTGYVDTVRVTVPLTWADMNSPVPAATYRSMRDCQWWRADNCSTIYDDYKPDVVIPTYPAMFTHLDPKIANCSGIVWNELVLDPPIPLTTAGALVPQESAPAVTTNEDPEPLTTPAAPATETTAIAPSTAPAAHPATATATALATGGSGHDAGGSNSQPTAVADPPPSSGPSHDGSSENNPSDAGSADPADSNPWNNLGSMISGIWGAQPSAADSASAGSVPAAATGGSSGGNDDQPSNNGGGQQQQQPGSGANNHGNGASGLPVVETVVPVGNNEPNSQAPTLAPVIVTIGTALASAVSVAAPNPNANDGGNNGVAIGTQTLAAGHTTLIASHTVVAAPAGGALIVDGATSPLFTGGASAPPAPLATVGSPGVVAVDPENPSGVLVGDQPLAPGATTTVEGVQIAVPTNGGAVVIGGETHALPTTSSSSGASIPGIDVAPADPQDPGKGVIVGGSDNGATLTLGASTTIDGTQIVVPSTGGGGVVVVGGQTHNVPSPSAPATNAGSQSQATIPFSAMTDSAGMTTATAPAVLTLADGKETLTATPIAPGTVVLDDGSTTLSVGGHAATIQGSIVSLASDGLVVVNAGGLGGLIAGGLSGAVGSVIASAGATTTADTSRRTSSGGSAMATRARTGGGDDDDPSSTASASASTSRTEDGATTATAAATTTTAASGAGAASASLPVADLLSIFFMTSVIPFIFSKLL